jgi:hypothetical protein
MKKLLVLFTVLVSLFASDLKINKNGIKVYTFDVNNSKYDAFKASTEINAPFEKIKSVLLDFKNYPKWQKKISHIEIKDGYMLKILDFPFPFSDRFAFYKIVTKTAPDEIYVNLKSVPYDGLPQNIKKEFKKPSCVEMKDNVVLDAKKVKNGVLVTYSARVDPNGAPAFIFNSKIPGAAYETLNNLRALVK